MMFERSVYTDYKKESGMVLHGVELRFGKFCILSCNEYSFHKRLGFLTFSPAQAHLKYFKSNAHRTQGAPFPIYLSMRPQSTPPTSRNKLCEL